VVGAIVPYIGVASAVSAVSELSAEASYPGGEVALLWEDENAINRLDFEDRDWRYPAVIVEPAFVLVGFDKAFK